MDKSQIPFISATELAALIKSKEVSPVEATEAYLERIPQVDGKLNSYITITGERAMDDARKAEQEIIAGNYRGPMHGMPIAIKDQVYTKGILTTGGSTILKDFIPDEDATVVTKLNDAGAVLLGKLNMSEFAMGDAFAHPYGRPHNPWDLRIPLRNITGRRHRRVHSWPGILLRSSGNQAVLGTGQSSWRSGSIVVHGPGWPHLTHGFRLRNNPGGHRRSRPQRRANLGRASA